jgi:hypothetical protein
MSFALREPPDTVIREEFQSFHAVGIEAGNPGGMLVSNLSGR